jgi:hypothetical protein
MFGGGCGCCAEGEAEEQWGGCLQFRCKREHSSQDGETVGVSCIGPHYGQIKQAIGRDVTGWRFQEAGGG